MHLNDEPLKVNITASVLIDELRQSDVISGSCFGISPCVVGSRRATVGFVSVLL